MLARLDERVAAVFAAAFTIGVLLGPGEKPWINGGVALLFAILALRPGSPAPRRVIAGSISLFFVGLFVVFLHHGWDTRLEVENGPHAVQGRLLEDPIAAPQGSGLVVLVDKGPQNLIGRRVLLQTTQATGLKWRDPVDLQATLRSRPEPAAPKFRLTTPSLRRGAMAYGQAVLATSGETTSDASTREALLRPAGRPETLAQWAQSGLHPWYATSGLRFALFTGFFALVAAMFFRRRQERAAAQAGLLAVVLWLGAVQLDPTSLRMAVVIMAVAIPRAFRKSPPVLSSLALSVIVVLAVDPYALSDPAFQLGFTAVVGALRLAPAAINYHPRLQNPWLRPWLVLVCVVAAMTPLTARLFDQVGIATLIGCAGLIALSFFFALPLALQQAFGWTGGVGGLQSLLTQLESTSAAVHQAVGAWWTPSVLECVIMYGLLTVAATPRGRGFRQVTRLHATLALVFTWTVVVVAGQYTSRIQGDAQAVVLQSDRGALIQDTSGTRALVLRDVAPWYMAECRDLSNEIKRRRVRRLDEVLSNQGEHAMHLAYVFAVDRMTTTNTSTVVVAGQPWRLELDETKSRVFDFSPSGQTKRELRP